MNDRFDTIRNSEKRQTALRARMSAPMLSLLVAMLLVTLPMNRNEPFTNRNSKNAQEPQTIRYWAAEAMSPSAELTAAAAAAVVRRNVISGAAIFTVGDAAAQMLTNNKKNNAKSNVRAAATTGTTTTSPILVAQGQDQAAMMISPSTTNHKPLHRIANAVSSLDRNRLYSSTVLGAIWSGFCVPFIYGTVETTFPGKANLRQILIKVLVTCSILSTIGNYVTMYARRFASLYITYQFDKTSSLRLLWRTKPVQSFWLFLAIFKGCFKSCNRDIGEVIVDDLKIWPLYDLTCYSIIPPTWRPITTSIMSSGWAMYMSVVSAKEVQEEEDDEEEEVVPVDAVVSLEEAPPAPATVETPPPPVVSEPQKIQVKPLNLFQKPPTQPAFKKLIGVHGGDASNNKFNNDNDPQRTRTSQ